MTGVAVDATELRHRAAARFGPASARPGRFVGLLGWKEDDLVHLAVLGFEGDRLDVERVAVRAGSHYPALTPDLPAASWYERRAHDLLGVVPDGHPDLRPLLAPPPPGAGLVSRRVAGEGVFSLPYGPVRSGVFETVEYRLSTIGEDLPTVTPVLHYKHRDVAARFAGQSVDRALLLAERVEGIASVAHALAFADAVERTADVEVPRPAAMVRVALAELERIANHLETVVRHTEGAGLAMANARFSFHKERVLRLIAALSGSRFGRGILAVGGLAREPSSSPAALLATLDTCEAELARDAALLMETPSFVDRLRGTGVLAPRVALAHGAVGPVGRGSGTGPDLRATRPYGAYEHLRFQPVLPRAEGDALARQHVRLEEIETSFHLVRQALGRLRAGGRTPGGASGGAGTASGGAGGPWRAPVRPVHGLVLGAVEAPQGELCYLVELDGGRVAHADIRTPSFHNLALFPHAFQGDIFTDFVFIEASFGLSLAGVAF